MVCVHTGRLVRLSIFHNIHLLGPSQFLPLNVEGCGLTYILHWVSCTFTDYHCRKYGTQIEVDWHDRYIAMI